MAHIERTIEIEAPPAAVFALLTDLSRLPDWSTTSDAVESAPEAPLAVGDTFRQTIRLVGRSLTTDWRVVELVRPDRIAYEATAEGGRLRMEQDVRIAGSGSRVELDLEYELPGGLIGELLDRSYVERRLEREADHSLQNLKELLETGQP